MSIIMSGSSIVAVVYDKLQVYSGKLYNLFPLGGSTAKIKSWYWLLILSILSMRLMVKQ